MNGSPGQLGLLQPLDRSSVGPFTRRRFLSLTGLALSGAAVGVSAAGCGTAQTGNQQDPGSSKGRAGAAGETMFQAGFQWQSPKSFNPLAASPDWPTNWDQSQN